MPTVNAESEQTYQNLFRSCPALIELSKECLSTGRTFRRQEVVAEIKDKGRRILEISISPIGKGYQDIHGALCLLADITEINALREQMQVRENLASLGEMSAGIAHEFKNSLATIQGFAQLIENTGTMAEISAALIDETRHLTQMVTDFLRFARPQEFQSMEVDLDQLIRDCVEELENLAEENDVIVSINGKIPNATGDEMMLRHSLLNLLRNAIEAMTGQPKRELNICGEIGNDAFGKPCAMIHVADTGCGIPGDILAKIFIPFFSTKSKGYGIGLAIVQKVFSGHGGHIEVISVEGEGTTFHCRLPLAAEQLQDVVTEQHALTTL
jgi:signal transduction histidine kinase